MKTLRAAFWIHLAVAVASLMVAAVLRELWIFALAFALLGVLWAITMGGKIPGSLLALRRQNGTADPPTPSWPAGSLLLFLLTAAAAAAVLLETPPWLALLAVTAALGAWDLDHFLRRLMSGGEVNFAGNLGRAHLRHLLIVEVLGFFLGLAAATLRLRLPFWWEVLLAALAVIGLSRLIQHLRAQTADDPLDELS